VRKMLAKSRKGFLGPIGDDLPSLIPLVFALTMFFYVFTVTWNVFDERNRDFDNDIAILRIASILKGNSYIPNHESFAERCEEAKSIRKMNFKAGLLPLPVKENEHFGGIDIENLRFFADPREPENVYLCTNSGKEPDIESLDFLVRAFPIALEMDYKDDRGERHFFVKPMLLVVVSW
jgi:hypothetical protein